MSSNQTKPDPADLLRQTFAQYQQLQSQLAQLRMRLLTILEVAGMSLGEANDLLGTEFFVKSAGQDLHNLEDD